MSIFRPNAPDLRIAPSQALWIALFVVAAAWAPAHLEPWCPARDDAADPRPPGSALLYADRLDVNAAAEADLETLPGIGPAKARAIVERRARAGGFCGLDEARRAAAVGTRAWARIVPWLELSPPGRCVSSGRASSRG